jgi:hypothetical protein
MYLCIEHAARDAYLQPKFLYINGGICYDVVTNWIERERKRERDRVRERKKEMVTTT